ncbi:Tektin-4 [Chelonia mydas]|uniref:Tektin n=1 Tax=Chelonia mydas TaxID=8469 RepID=M7BEB7_CHEMY|nr:Tektin-4 [Chelonia mydas]
MKAYEAALNTGPDSSCGLATAGFRTAKYLTEEWHQHNYAQYHQAFADRDGSERCRHESQRLAAYAAALAQRTQEDSTAKLGQRLQDTHFWKAELQRETEDLSAETDLLAAQKAGRQSASHRGALHPRPRLNRDHKQICEMDWSDKVETYNIDDKCGRYNNQSTNIQFHPSSSKFEESASTPETWAKFSHDNIYRAERERLASINLRLLIDNILHDTAEDLHLQCAAVNEAFAKRCEEMEDAKHKLEHHLKKIQLPLATVRCSRPMGVAGSSGQYLPQPTPLLAAPIGLEQRTVASGRHDWPNLRTRQTLKEIGDQENNIAALKQAIKDKEAPLKVAQTRLYDRSFRPNVELCRDPAQFRLISEVEELTESIESLKQKLLEAEQSLRNLEDTRMSLEKEIAVKSNSIFIDRQKCMAHRTRYPVVLKLAGYQ